MPKPNYRLIQKQKEAARVARQQQKLTRRLAKPADTPGPAGAADAPPPGDGRSDAT